MYAPKNTTKDFESCPTGWQLGVCARVIDLGTHWYQDKRDPTKGKFKRKLSVAFESQHKMKEGEFAGQPFLLYANFNYSMYQGKAHLCTFIENWRGKRFASQEDADRFDLAKLIGQKAFMNVVRSDDGKFTNIQTIGPVPEGMKAPEIVGKTILVDQSSLDMNDVNKLSDKMKERVLSSQEQTEGNALSGQSSAGQYQGHSAASQTTATLYENPGHGLTDADAGFSDLTPGFDDRDIPFLQYGFRTVI